MALTPQETEAIEAVASRLKQALLRSLTEKPEAQRESALHHMEAMLHSQDAVDPVQHPRDWFHPLRSFVDWLEDQRLFG